ncbi:MAG: hypothetical protein VKK80_13870 [Prochlorothrix sp.]|nr:hypothetical protein [Prochlorothrix sp.]
MTNPVLHAFFVGRALAQGIGEQVERNLTDALSELGKFDAENRERIREFTEQVMARAQAEEGTVASAPASSASGDPKVSEADLQELLDNLRAEIAQLRTKLQEYRDQ